MTTTRRQPARTRHRAAFLAELAVVCVIVSGCSSNGQTDGAMPASPTIMGQTSSPDRGVMNGAGQPASSGDGADSGQPVSGTMTTGGPKDVGGSQLASMDMGGRFNAGGDMPAAGTLVGGAVNDGPGGSFNTGGRVGGTSVPGDNGLGAGAVGGMESGGGVRSPAPGGLGGVVSQGGANSIPGDGGDAQSPAPGGLAGGGTQDGANSIPGDGGAGGMLLNSGGDGMQPVGGELGGAPGLEPDNGGELGGAPGLEPDNGGEHGGGNLAGAQAGGAEMNAAVGGQPGPDDGGGIDRAVYPGGPYGSDVGATIADLEFIHWDNFVYRLSDIRQIAEVKLIVLVTAAAWCPACMGKMAGLGMIETAYRDRGVFTAAALYQDDRGEAADAADAQVLRRRHSAALPTLADPDRVLSPYFQRFGRDKIIMIDARTMTIVTLSNTYQNASLEESIVDWLNSND